MDAKKWIKMQKLKRKLAEVCTNKFFLYKSGQVYKKCAIRLLVILYVFTWTPGKRGQMPPSETKEK